MPSTRNFKLRVIFNSGSLVIYISWLHEMGKMVRKAASADLDFAAQGRAAVAEVCSWLEAAAVRVAAKIGPKVQILWVVRRYQRLRPFRSRLPEYTCTISGLYY